MRVQEKIIYSVNEFDYVMKHFINKILTEGQDTKDRTGTGTKSIFSEKISVDVSTGIPLTTLKFTPFKNTLRELLWFLNGSSHIDGLHTSVKRWWSPWAVTNGSIGEMYGYMLRKYKSIGYKFPILSRTDKKEVVEIDQFRSVLWSLEHDPTSRRHVISLWNPNVSNMALANCHGTHIQFYVENGKLSMDTHQRSMDFMLGGFVNFASYAILLHIVARCTGLTPSILNYNIGDMHIYNNHIEGAKELLTREPIECSRQLVIHRTFNSFSLNYSHDTLPSGRDKDIQIDDIVRLFQLKDYKYHEGIKLDLAI